MAKVIRTIVAENGMSYDKITAFKTLSYVGIWDQKSQRFAVIETKCSEFFVEFIDIEVADTLKKLDDEVYEITHENILEVFDYAKYRLELEVEE